MEKNPLEELYQAAVERKDGRFKVLSAAYVVEMIDMYRLRETYKKAVSRGSKR